jgi:hypothetical protein
MKTKKADYLGWTFWGMWVLANTVAWIMGMAVLWILSFILDPLVQGTLNILGWAVVGAVIGAIYGVNHWFLFRPLGADTIGKWAHWWVLATIGGWSLSILVIVGLGAGSNLGFAITGAVFGIAVGIPQWFVLRPYAQKAEWWAVGNTAGWMIGLALLDVINRTISFPLVGVISGGLTGAVMIWLLRNPTSQPRQETVERSGGVE